MNLLPPPKKLKKLLPASRQVKKFIAASRESAQNIVQGNDRRFLIIAGPCSIHERASALEYAEKLKELADLTRDTCFLVMRAFVEKPRTAAGWKGLLYDPHLDETHDIETGLAWSRELFLHLAEMEVPAATEFVDPLTAPFFDDLITWGFIGARTSSSQPHRQLASSLPFPVGLKNGLDGDIEQAIGSLVSATAPHAFLCMNEEGRLSATHTAGNPLSHLVLRGSLTQPNYSAAFLEEAALKLEEKGLPPRLLVDCAHGNCQKNSEKQKEVFTDIVNTFVHGGGRVFGAMLESHLKAGSQSLTGLLDYGVSITDSCLDWDSTQSLILSADSSISQIIVSSGVGGGAE